MCTYKIRNWEAGTSEWEKRRQILFSRILFWLKIDAKFWVDVFFQISALVNQKHKLYRKMSQLKIAIIHCIYVFISKCRWCIMACLSASNAHVTTSSFGYTKQNNNNS